MKAYERKQLIARIEREGATVGASIPASLDVDGEPFPLREFVLEVGREGGPAADDERVEETKKRLRRERLRRKRRLERADIDREEGERLVETIVGLDRALNVLEGSGSTDLEAEAAAREAADRKRWLTFLRKATGTDAESRNRRTR